MKKTLLLLFLLVIVSAGLFADEANADSEQGKPSLTLDVEYTSFSAYSQSWRLMGRGEYITDEVVIELSGPDSDAFSAEKYLLLSDWGDGMRYPITAGFTANDGIRVYNATVTIRSGEASASLDLTGVVTSANIGRLDFGEVKVGTTSPGIKVKTLGGMFGNENNYNFYVFGREYEDESTEIFSIVDRKYNPETYEGEFTVVLTPERVKKYGAELTIQWGTSVKIAIWLAGDGVENDPDNSPYLKASPTELDFPNQRKGKTSKQTVHVFQYNSADEVSYELSGEGASAYMVSLVDKVDSGIAYNTYEVSFTPEEVAVPYDASIIFNTPDAEPLIIKLSGNASPVIAFSEAGLNFGEVGVNSDETKELALTVTVEDLVGDISYRFTNDSGNIFTIDERNWDPASGGTLYVRFDPDYLYGHSNIIEFSTPGAPDSYISVYGRGIEVPGYPIITIDNSSLGFINPYLDTESEPQFITVSGADMSGDISYSFAGGECESRFTVKEVSWDSLTGGTLAVTYTPKNDNIENPYIPTSHARLVFEGGGAVGKYIDLTGSALSILNNDTGIIDFGEVEIGETSTRVFIVSGVNAELHDGINILFGYKDHWYFSCKASSNPENYLSKVDVTFTPDREKDYEGALYITTDSFCGIDLRGTGVAPNPTSVDTIGNDSQPLLVYPNPASTQATVKTSKQNIGKTIEVYSVNGILLSSNTVSGITTQIDVSGLAKGIYLLRMGETYGKLIKE